MTIRLKIIVCAIWTIVIVSALFFQIHSFANGNSNILDDSKTKPKPEKSLIDQFDKALQARFYTEPSFGIRRLEPLYKPNPHFENFDILRFNPKTNEEKWSVEDFEKGGWKVSLYLFGRRAIPKNPEKGSKEFNIEYRLNSPLLVTKGVKIEQVTKPAKMQAEIKQAFDNFQNTKSPNNENYEFSIGQWSYVARPVRAANETCIKCHQDYVAIPESDGKGYQYRRRQIGDANGILVYGFMKDK